LRLFGFVMTPISIEGTWLQKPGETHRVVTDWNHDRHKGKNRLAA
jgi:hypothetical protein